MKMNATHYEYLYTAINALDRDTVLAHKSLELGNDKVKRFVWDLYYMINASAWICGNLYSYLNDSHIETALKSIARECNYI
jgi:hypothetical protein